LSIALGALLSLIVGLPTTTILRRSTLSDSTGVSSAGLPAGGFVHPDRHRRPADVGLAGDDLDGDPIEESQHPPGGRPGLGAIKGSVEHPVPKRLLEKLHPTQVHRAGADADRLVACRRRPGVYPEQEGPLGIGRSEGVDEGGQAVGRPETSLYRRAHSRQVLVGHLGKGLCDEVVLGLEVVVDEPGADAGLGGDVASRGL
jgi:hypothetical protein